MPKQCCKTNTKFVRESHIADCNEGQCVVCGTVIHGYKCNWRIVKGPSGGAYMHYREALRVPSKSRKESGVAFTKPKRLDRKELEGLSMEQMMQMLRSKGIVP